MLEQCPAEPSSEIDMWQVVSGTFCDKPTVLPGRGCGNWDSEMPPRMPTSIGAAVTVTGNPERGTLLALLADADREALLGLGGERNYSRGEHLMHQGEPGDERVLVLLEGHVKATFADKEGREIVLSFRGPGDVLGELSFGREERRSSNVLAIEPVRARAIATGDFRAFLQRTPTAALTLIDVLGHRFRDANRARVQFAAADTLGRVAARLIELCERYGRNLGEGVEIQLPITQADLGGWTASSRAAVAEALRTMRELGWIETGRRRITVLDLAALAARAS
jgi:CRP-like cAMP-binding protein